MPSPALSAFAGAGFVSTFRQVGYVSAHYQLVRLDRRADQAKQNIDLLLKQSQDELTKLIDAE